MNINYLKSISKQYIGPENLLKNNIKNLINGTNFEIIGEELYFNKTFHNTKGQCDLWLANPESNFLLSIELKTGYKNDYKKKKKLLEQTIKYNEIMSDIFQEQKVYGLGIYLTYCKNIQYYDIGNNKEIEKLKKSVNIHYGHF